MLKYGGRTREHLKQLGQWKQRHPCKVLYIRDSRALCMLQWRAIIHLLQNGVLRTGA